MNVEYDNQEGGDGITPGREYAVFESLKYPVSVIGADGGLVYGNEAYRKFFSSFENEIRLNWEHPFFPEYRKRVAQAYLGALNGSEKQCFAIINSPEGADLPVEMFLFPMMRGSEVASILVLMKFVDRRLLSFDRSTLSFISEEDFKYENLCYEFSPMPILRLDDQHEIIKVSHSLEGYLGYTLDEILVEKAASLKSLFQYDAERIKRAISEIIGGTAPFQRLGEVKISVKEGGDKVANLVLYPIVMNNEIAQVEMVIEDISRIKELKDKVNSMNRMKLFSDITKGFLHSLNNSLNVILSKTQLLLQITEKPSVTEGIQLLEQSALDIADQVKRIQNFISARTEIKDDIVESIVKIIEDSIEFSKMQFKVEDKENRRNIVIDRKYFSRANIKTDTRLLREIIISIILKVSNFIQKSGIINLVLKENNDLSLAVRIKKEDLAETGSVLPSMVNIFSGIDIRQVAEIVKLKIIEVESSEFYEIKAIFPQRIIVSDQQSEAPAMTYKLRDLDIIIVEDEIALQKILFELFDRMGNRVFICENGQKAIEEFKRKRYDLVIADYGLEGITGLELVTRVKEINEEVITILLSGWILNDLKAYGNVIDLFIPKPFHIEDLLKDIAKVMHDKRSAAK